MAKKKLNEIELPQYELADVVAIQALARGDADEHQQKRALKWIIENAAAMYEFSYYPTDRDTNFGLGRVFVGQVIVGILKLNAAALRRKENA